MEICITRSKNILPQTFQTVLASAEKGLSFLSGELLADRASPYFPERSDEKIMREDVKASVVAAQTMLEGLSPEMLADTDLYVANGVFIEDTGKQLQRVIDAYRQIDSNFSENEKIKKLYQATPPLLALQTLTNSSMSFISQYTGIKGNNATFGNTSQSAFHAIEKAMTAMDAGAERAVVCASNSGGVVSFLTNQSFFADHKNWKESAGIACLLFEQKENNQSSLCRIIAMKTNNHIADSGKSSWHLLPVDANATAIIFSGAFTEEAYETDLAYCRSFGKNPFSFFPEYGNLGSANLVFSIIKAIDLIASGPEKKIDIFDRDVYGRESYFRIEK